MSRTGALRIAMTATALALGGMMAQAQQVGTASAVNPAATANLKTITIGQSIAHKERIQTKSSGSVQLLFLDKTSMTIGPNSDITIDEYVYDPSANTGKLAATLGKGALRFVGGQISHNGDAEIKTASALIGIRGGVMMTDGKGGIYSGYGTMTVSSGGQTVSLGAGEFTQTQPGGPPTPPGLPPPGFVQQLIAAFQSAAGQTGGVRAGTASAKNIASAEQKATGSPGGSVTGSNVPTTPPPIVELINAISSAFTQSVQTSSQSAAVQQFVHDQPTGNDNPPPVDNTPRPTVTLTGYAGGMDIIAGHSLTGTVNIGLDATANTAQAAVTVSDPSNPNTSTRIFQFDPTTGGYGDYKNFVAISSNGALGTTDNQTVLQAISTAIPNLTPCQCEYTRWGLWVETGSATTTTNGPTASPSEGIVGWWVAGRPVGSIGDVPTTGLATYTGHVIATVNSNAGFAAGNFSNTVDFGARTGAVSVTNLDNTNYTGNVNFNTDDRRYFGGTIDSTNVRVDGRSMALQGSFFQGARSPVGEMGGSVAISSTKDNYLGSGIFAASQR
ncbi:conserved hypothetical protein [Nitrobacter hamburgensis X14]|uniref:FecR protein domain-containing protein n=1 Tax=Nitrobacter hamburgensis (strain DSM 10229 / NCIMB 13809 / X14) TaxID=323097 RepID=Q1QMC3_NITHX|nr:FecR domain-containing protein [Nitrobacter hamburgensis]ABE62624.1 conserved hypothetical protein [Nitrobacter hamburgensis X14]